MTKKLCLFTKMFSLLAVISLIFSSCEGDKHYYEGSETRTITATVLKEHWEWDDKLGGYFCDVEIPELTTSIITNGSIVVAKDLGKDTFRPLGYTDYYETQNNKGEWYTYSETVDCEYRPNFIRFFVYRSDFIGNDDKLETMTFKISMTYQ